MNTRTKIILVIALISLGVAGRILPHAWNFAPILASGIFAGAYLGKKYGLLVPVAAMLISDAFIGFYSWQMNISVYIAMGLSGFLGVILSKSKNPIRIALVSALGSTLFYLITNGAVWYFTTMYEPNIGGLFASYTAAIPFFRNAIVGDIWYCYAFFGLYEFARYMIHKLAPVKSLVS